MRFMMDPMAVVGAAAWAPFPGAPFPPGIMSPPGLGLAPGARPPPLLPPSPPPRDPNDAGFL